MAARRTLAAPARTGLPERAHPAPPPPGDSDAGCQGSVRGLESPAGCRPCRLGAAWRDGRLGPLLPSGGRLDNAFFQEVIAALAAVAPHRRAGVRPDRALAAALDDLGELARRWAREPDAMGRRNGLGAAADGAAVAGRLEAIGGAVAALGV
jgi:hypothetical protein